MTLATLHRPHNDRGLFSDDPAATVTIRETIADYLVDCEAEGFDPTTIDKHKRDLGAFATWLESSGHPTDMHHLQGARGATIVKLYMRYLEQHGGRDGGPGAPGNLAAKFRQLKAFGHWCVKSSRDVDGQPNNPPFMRQSFADRDLVKAPKDTPADDVGKPYSNEELQRLLAEFGSERSSNLRIKRNRALVLVLRFAGIRRAEAAKVLVEHYDPQNGTIHLPDGVAKRTRRTSDQRTTIICNARAQLEVNGYVKLLKAGGRGTGPLFLSFRGGRSLRPDAISDLIGRAVDRVQDKCSNRKSHSDDLGCEACIEHSGVHRLRATWASEQRMSGAPDSAIMAAAGWESLVMLDRYSRHVKNEAALTQLKRVNGLH